MGPPEGVPIHVLGEEGGQEQRRRFSGDSGNSEHDAGDDSADRRGNDDLDDHLVLGYAQGERPLTEFVGDDLQHLLGRLDDDGDHQDAQRQACGQPRLGEAEGQDPEREDEHAGDDGRDTGHHIDEEVDAPSQSPTPVLAEVDSCADTDRDRDQSRDADLGEGADDGVEDAAPFGAGVDVTHRGGQELQVDDRDALGDDGDENPRQGNDRGRCGQVDGGGCDPIGGVASALDRERPPAVNEEEGEQCDDPPGQAQDLHPGDEKKEADQQSSGDGGSRCPAGETASGEP